MAEIIPAIIAKSFPELRKKIKLVEIGVKTVQLDVMDGIFVNNKTWDRPEELKKIKTSLLCEAHLMVAEPRKILKRWLEPPKVCRIILHWEATDVKVSVAGLSREIRASGKEFGLALNPETQISVLDDVVGELDLVLLMGVDPGFAGQAMKPEIISKIRIGESENKSWLFHSLTSFAQSISFLKIA